MLQIPVFLEIANKAAQPLAALGGAVWGIYLYRRNRTHKHRLRLSVSTGRTTRAGIEYLLVKTKLENVGMARVSIAHRGCLLTIFADQTPQGIGFAWDPDWEVIGNFDLLNDHDYLEPSSVINDEVLVAVPGLDNRFLKVRTHVESETVAWNAIALAGPASSSQPVLRD